MCLPHGRLFCSECRKERGLNISKLQNEVWKIAEESGWHEKEVSFGDFISNCHAELSEAFEIYKTKGSVAIPAFTPFEWMEHYSNGKVDMKTVVSVPSGIPIELADVIMRILDFCETHGINMENTIDIKMEYNKTREYRHGGKVV
jgi:hypothetical protein